ncbi:MAG TPA: hypothetical protein VK506_14240 [Conexibacter sp.]|nr:hypothetical protein [Conexibacter sp.]
MLPQRIRADIWKAFRRHGAASLQYGAASDDALEYWGAHHPLAAPPEQLELQL